jgi:hypothetical protein
VNSDLLQWLAACNKDPMAFVLGAFPWGEVGSSLEDFTGPEPWQAEILEDIRVGLLTPDEAIQLAVASGHGIGKSACVAWIILWAFATAPDTRGVVTANTETQLKTKTWAELGKWFNLFIAREHFVLTATALLSRDPSRERTWRIDQVPWSEKNTEAFAGMHNKGKRLLLVMDEASAIPDVIHEVAEGALTDSDTEILWLMFGNPTRNTGRFKEAFEGGLFHQFWKCRRVDSRTVSITNKRRIARWIEAYKEDSDFVRIRVLGEFPRRGLMEFFNAEDIDAAMAREVTVAPTDPLVLGVDVARFGANSSVIFPRKGRDARTIPRQVYSGLDTVALAQRVFTAQQQYHASGVMVDGGGVGGGVVDTLRNMRLYIYEVQFGAKDDYAATTWGNTGERYANKRAAMYGALRWWLKTGAIPNDPELKRQLLSIRYGHNRQDQILLESKEDLIDEDGNGISVDDVDALAITFAFPVASHVGAGGDYPMKPLVETEWDPFSAERMAA